MFTDVAPFLPALGFFGHFAGTIICVLAAFWIAKRGDRSRSDRLACAAAVALLGLWSGLAASLGPLATVAQLATTASDIVLVYCLFRLFENDGRASTSGPVKWVVISLGFALLLELVMLLVATRFVISGEIETKAFDNVVLLRMLVCIGALVLLHNLFAGAAAATRQLLRWSALGLAGLWAFDFNLYAIAFLGGEAPALLLAVRGFVISLFVVALAIGASQAAAGLKFSPSRTVTFQTLSLFVIGAYLLALLFFAQSLPALGGDFARLAQVGFLVLACLGALFWFPSSRARGWLRIMAAKHLFRHRYDYRSEWLRFTRTISQIGNDDESFHQRAVKAMADLTGSGAGLLLMPNEEGELELVARWQWPSIEVPATAANVDLAAMLEQDNFILDLDELRDGEEYRCESNHIPRWMLEAPDVWAVVPLLHFDRLVGAVVLARPVDQRRLDWEDFDLLRVVGQQLASYLAEQSGHQALLEASRFDEFNRRIAFVMHDIKNLASQLSLLASNAEKHADNPDFRADMLVTLSNSADKLNGLLARLGRYGAGGNSKHQPIELSGMTRDIAQRYRSIHPVDAVCEKPCTVLANSEALDQALTHLVQNAIDASHGDIPVYLNVRVEGITGIIEVVDAGQGMSPEFVRNGLFKPFVSSKDGGFGIGAFEARELIRAMGGRLSVESREGIGTRFIVTLPVHTAKAKQNSNSADHSEVA